MSTCVIQIIGTVAASGAFLTMGWLWDSLTDYYTLEASKRGR